MPVKVYQSRYPYPYTPNTSIFQYLLPDKPADSPNEFFNPNLTAFICGLSGRSITRAQLKDSALRLATGLKGLGLTRGDYACMWGLNSLEWAVAAYGMMAAGLTISPANYAYETKEITHQLNNSNSKAIFVEPALLPRLEQARAGLAAPLPDHRIILLCTPEAKPKGTKYKCMYDIFGEPAAAAERFDGPDSYRTAWLCYSSGTTGLPKGVESTHFNITSELQGAKSLPYVELRCGVDTILGVLPLSHIFALVLVLMQPVAVGVPVVIMPRFEEKSVMTAIQKYHCTYSCVVPPIILSMVNSPNTANGTYDISSLHTVLSGAAPLGPDLIAKFEKKFPNIHVAQGYGMTETQAGCTMLHPRFSHGIRHSCGQLLGGFSARLVRPDGLDAGDNEAGELWLKGPAIMKGYHANEAATKDTFSDDWWFKTGDVAVVDSEGFFAIVDRTKELIKYKGFQVPPAELEALLLQHPSVHDAGVIGIYDEAQVTELPRAYIVASPEQAAKHAGNAGAVDAFAAEVAAWVAARVAPHKKLRGGVVVIDAIPKSVSGKILRKDLREQAKKELEGKSVSSATAKL